MVQVAKLQDKRGLSDLSQICEEYTLLYEATDIWGVSIGILSRIKLPHAVQTKRR